MSRFSNDASDRGATATQKYDARSFHANAISDFRADPDAECAEEKEEEEEKEEVNRGACNGERTWRIKHGMCENDSMCADRIKVWIMSWNAKRDREEEKIR